MTKMQFIRFQYIIFKIDRKLARLERKVKRFGGVFNDLH